MNDLDTLIAELQEIRAKVGAGQSIETAVWFTNTQYDDDVYFSMKDSLKIQVEYGNLKCVTLDLTEDK